jgi:hypothetical protein
VAEDKLYDKIFYKEESKIEILGDVVTETAKTLDRLIYDALKKHQRLDNDSPGSRSPRNRKKSNGLYRNRNGATSTLSMNRLAPGVTESNSKDGSSRDLLN